MPLSKPSVLSISNDGPSRCHSIFPAILSAVWSLRECECQTCSQWSIQLGLESKFQRSISNLSVHWLVRFLGYPHEIGSTSGLYYIQVPPDMSETFWVFLVAMSSTASNHTGTRPHLQRINFVQDAFFQCSMIQSTMGYVNVSYIAH
jgi:hypothetical protein